MYNNGNSSKNVTGSSVVDGTLVTADIADDAVTADKLANSINTDIATGVTANTTASAALPKAGGTITGNLISEATNTFGKSTSAVTTTVKSSINWNYPEFKVQRNSSNTANFKAISFMLDGDSDSNTDLYGYPSIIINTDTAPTTGDTSAAENASMTINTPSTIRFGTGSAERMRILSSGGITFNGDTAAANALDDYEEGTWDPEFDPASGAFGSISYNIQSGKYTKVGNMVHVQGEIRTSAITVGTASGDCRISGLPFTANARSTLAIGYVVSFAGDEPLACRVEISTDRFQLHSRGAVGGNSANTQISHLDTGSSKNWINFSGVYQVS